MQVSATSSTIVQDIVETADQLLDVLAVEGSDEGLLESMADVVADAVALVFQVDQLARDPLALVVRLEELNEHPRRGEDVLRIVDEEVEECLLAGNER